MWDKIDRAAKNVGPESGLGISCGPGGTVVETIDRAVDNAGEKPEVFLWRGHLSRPTVPGKMW
jgi:hypothetical protein